jgi:glutathione S-transferase
LTPDFVALNVVAQVPVLKHGDFVITESMAICTYLVKAFAASDNWYPKDPKKRAKISRFLYWQHNAIREPLEWLFYNNVLAKLGALGATFEEWRSARAAGVLNGNEARRGSWGILELWLSETAYIAGDELSLADIIGYYEIWYA